MAGVCYVILANWGKGNNGMMEEWKRIVTSYTLRVAGYEMQVSSFGFLVMEEWKNGMMDKK